MQRPPEVTAMINNAGEALYLFQRILRAGERYVWEGNPAPMLERALGTVDTVLLNAPSMAIVDDVLELRFALSDALETCRRIRAEYEPVHVS